MKFTVHKLITEGEIRKDLAFTDIKPLFKEYEVVNFQLGDFEYFFTPISLEQTRCFFEIKYGKRTATDCFSKPDKQFKSDILSDNLIHTMDQFFILIDFNPDETCMYISDPDKKNIFAHYCSSKKLDIKILDQCNDVDSFIEQIKKVNSVRLKSTTGLFISEYLNPSYLQEWDNAAPKSFALTINYDCEIDKKTLKRQYKNLKEKIYLEDIVFEGSDDEDRVLQFNGKALIMKKDINIKKLETGYFDAMEVFSKLKESIK